MTIVQPFAIGCVTHVVALLLARRLTAALGQPFRLEVVTGDSGLAAMADVARAPADGHRLVLSPSGTFVVPPLGPPSPLATERDFASIGLLASRPQVLCAHADSVFRALREMVEAARRAPDPLRHAAAGG